jgi:GNAT superfamily N-acetyltransferase
MKLIEITENDAWAKKEFLHLPLKLYKNDPNFIRPLDADINLVFDKQKNPNFQYGECIRWILQDDTGKIVGRIASFYDTRKMNVGNEQPTGGMGFFECINNQDYANMLFEACKNWLKTKNIEAMDGPVNFGSRDKWWGLLVDGFTPPNYCVPYNFPYYRQLLENYGFKDYFQQYTYYRRVDGPKLAELFYAKAERVLRNKSYTFEHIKLNNLNKYAEDFRVIYNESWAKHAGTSQMTETETQALMAEMKPIIDEKLIWFAYYDGQPIGVMVMIPELNQIFKYVGGKMDFLGKIKFAYYHYWQKKCRRILGVVIGIRPRFQKFGIESALIAEFSKVAYNKNFNYQDLEFNWTGDFLPVMMRLYESFECEISKTHITFRKLFDETKPFTRCPVIQ